MEAEAGNQFEDDEGRKWWWKSCAAPGCQNYICRGYSEDFCYVHLPTDARARKDADMAAS